MIPEELPRTTSPVWHARSRYLRWTAGGLAAAVSVTLLQGPAAAAPQQRPAKPEAATTATDIAPAKSPRAAQQSKAVDLVTLGEGDEQITLRWKGGLPEPRLDGTRAEYVNAAHSKMTQVGDPGLFAVCGDRLLCARSNARTAHRASGEGEVTGGL